MFNDTPVSNRVYAYLANVELSKFNELEMEVVKRLNYTSIINPEEYQAYKKELDIFWKNKNEVLSKCYKDYKHDKLILKEIKTQIFSQQLNLKINRRHAGTYSNYSDSDFSETIEKMISKENDSRKIESTDKFRFESYNSHNFKENKNWEKSWRSKSVEVCTL